MTDFCPTEIILYYDTTTTRQNTYYDITTTIGTKSSQNLKTGSYSATTTKLTTYFMTYDLRCPYL
jgi:hypothetical protein